MLSKDPVLVFFSAVKLKTKTVGWVKATENTHYLVNRFHFFIGKISKIVVRLDAPFFINCCEKPLRPSATLRELLYQSISSSPLNSYGNVKINIRSSASGSRNYPQSGKLAIKRVLHDNSRAQSFLLMPLARTKINVDMSPRWIFILQPPLV